MDRERVELHCHTCMSRMNGVSNIEEILSFVQKQNMTAVAITDHSSILAYPDIQRLIEKQFDSIKPIYGIEFLVTEDILPEFATKSKVRFDGKPAYYVLALIKNETGLKNIYQLLSEACMREDNHPRISWSRLQELHDGLLIGSACVAGELIHSIINGVAKDVVKAIASRYDFLEVQPASNDIWLIESEKTENIKCIADMQSIQKKIIAIGEELGIPVVATSDAHYVRPENEISRKVLLNARGWGQEARGDLYIRTTAEMLAEFSYLPQEKAYEIVVENSNKIAEEIELLTPIPKCKYVPVIKDADIKLKKMCMKAALEKYQENGTVYGKVLERLDMELNNIKRWGFAEIYLNYAEIINKNKLRPLQYGLKGLGASSIVSYLLGISKIDPLNEECPLYVELFSAIDGSKEPDFDLTVDERVWKQVRTSLNDLEGIEAAVWVTSYQSPSEDKIKSWVEDYESVEDTVLSEPDRNVVKQDLRNVIMTGGKRLPRKFCMVPNGRLDILPMGRDTDNAEDVFLLDWWKMNHIFRSYDICDSKLRTLLCRLEEECGGGPGIEDINYQEFAGQICDLIESCIHDEDIVRWQDILSLYQPHSYKDVIRISALVHGSGVWEENGKNLILSETVSPGEIIATCEDVYEMLISHNIPKENAYEITNYIRRGRMAVGKYHPEYTEEMLSYGVPKWFVESSKKIRYLFSRAHCTEYMHLILNLLFYKRNYTQIFENNIDSYVT